MATTLLRPSLRGARQRDEAIHDFKRRIGLLRFDRDDIIFTSRNAD
jgi:hypothetical protein